jgi:threonine synthase
MTTAYQGLLHRYRDRLPVVEGMRIITLCEGNTPLIPLTQLPRKLGRDVTMYVKFEGLNPTGSFKDRGMTMAVTQAVHEGARAIICASTGNTSASAAAYAARAGIRSFVLIPEGKIAMGKLAQAMMHGAIVIQIQGNFDDGMRLVKEVATRAPVTIVNSINPYRIQGQKTAAFEIVEALGRAPDYHCIPVGNAGNITAHWLGYRECAAAATLPVMAGYQAAGAAPFISLKMVDQPETVATAIRIGHPQSWDAAWEASRASGGWFAAHDDATILETQKLLAGTEGIFCEPASAISVAGAIADIKSGRIRAGSTIVCTVTGHGLKDPDTAIASNTAPVLKIPATLDDVRRAIVDHL